MKARQKTSTTAVVRDIILHHPKWKPIEVYKEYASRVPKTDQVEKNAIFKQVQKQKKLLPPPLPWHSGAFGSYELTPAAVRSVFLIERMLRSARKELGIAEPDRLAKIVVHWIGRFCELIPEPEKLFVVAVAYANYYILNKKDDESEVDMTAIDDLLIADNYDAISALAEALPAMIATHTLEVVKHNLPGLMAKVHSVANGTGGKE